MKRTIRLFSIFNFLTDFSFFAPVAVIYYARVSGSFALGMSVFSIIMLAAAVMEVPTGIFSDRIGRKRTMLLGAACEIIAVVCYAVGLSYIWLVLGAIFNGTARAFYSGNNDAYLHDILVDNHLEAEYHEYLGKTSAMFQVALAISALLGGILAQWSFALVVWLTVIPAVLKLAIGFQFAEPRARLQTTSNVYAHLREAVALFWKNKQLRLLSLAGMFDFAIGESQYQFRAAFVNTLWPLWAIGFSNMLSNIGGAIGFYWGGKAVKKFKELPLILIGDIYSKCINFVSLVWPTPLSPALMSTNSIFYGTGSVAQSNLLQQQFTEHQRATMGSLDSLGGSLMFAAFSLLLGSVADRFSPVQGLLLFQVFSLLPIALYFTLFLRSKGRVSRAQRLDCSA